MFVKVVVLLLVLVLAVTSSMLVGTPVNADIKDPKIKQAVLFAIAAYNAKSESIYTSKVLKVINAQSQVRRFLEVFLKIIAKIHNTNG